MYGNSLSNVLVWYSRRLIAAPEFDCSFSNLHFEKFRLEPHGALTQYQSGGDPGAGTP